MRSHYLKKSKNRWLIDFVPDLRFLVCWLMVSGADFRTTFIANDKGTLLTVTLTDGVNLGLPLKYETGLPIPARHNH